MSSMGDRLDVLNALHPGNRHPAITAPAAEGMLRRLQERPDLEHAFRCGWDGEAETLISAAWLSRGTRSLVVHSGNEFQAGEMFIHNHPSPGDLVPSETDVEAAAALARQGVGFGIVSSDLRQFLLVRPPVPPAYLHEVRTWRLGPLALSYSRLRKATP